MTLLELNVNRIINAPTIPVYDTAPDFTGEVPQDENGLFVGPVFIIKNWGTDGVNNTIPTLAWYGAGYFFYTYFDSFLHNVIGRPSIVGDIPQDVVQGQLALGSDHSLNWFVDGVWWGKQGVHCFNVLRTGTPQDQLEGQVALGANGLFWFVDGAWYGFQLDQSSRAYPF